jgi:hypothetical protein
MQPELSLSLELLEDAVDSIRLRLTVSNRSDAKLALPCLHVDGLRFVNRNTLEESKWGRRALMSGAWGFTVEPGETEEVDYHLPAFHLVAGDWEGEPAKWDGKTFGDEVHAIELPSGDYLVWYQLKVGQDFFDCISNFWLRDLQGAAETEQAVAWTGEQKSNRLHVVRV